MLCRSILVVAIVLLMLLDDVEVIAAQDKYVSKLNELNSQGIKYFQHGNVSDAIQVFNEALALSTEESFDRLNTLNNLWACYRKIGDSAKAAAISAEARKLEQVLGPRYVSPVFRSTKVSPEKSDNEKILPTRASAPNDYASTEKVWRISAVYEPPSREDLVASRHVRYDENGREIVDELPQRYQAEAKDLAEHYAIDATEVQFAKSRYPRARDVDEVEEMLLAERLRTGYFIFELDHSLLVWFDSNVQPAEDSETDKHSKFDRTVWGVGTKVVLKENPAYPHMMLVSESRMLQVKIISKGHE